MSLLPTRTLAGRYISPLATPSSDRWLSFQRPEDDEYVAGATGRDSILQAVPYIQTGVLDWNNRPAKECFRPDGHYIIYPSVPRARPRLHVPITNFCVDSPHSCFFSFYNNNIVHRTRRISAP